MKCSNCGSMAINHHLHGRDGSKPKLCDVCYWRERAENQRSSTMTLSKHMFKRDEKLGSVIGEDGCHYENEAEALYCDIFGFCGCGDLDSVLCFILKCLGSSSDEYDKIICPEKIKELVLKHPLEVTEFILHFFDSKNLTEHGGSVYASSLTDLGLQAVKVGETWQGI